MAPPPPEGMSWGQYSDQKTFKQVLADAVAAMSDAAFVSPAMIEGWAIKLRNAAERSLGSDRHIDDAVRIKLGRVYDQFMRSQKLVRMVPGVTAFTKAIVQPQLRAELDRRIWANADLIKNNKSEAVDQTIRRLSGWASSIPPGGSSDDTQREVRSVVGKSVAQASYERRRVDIDQTHKLIANVSNLVAVGSGAIAGVWHSHGEHDKSYKARKEHLARAGRTYILRDSWADKEGLIAPVHGYYDEIDAVGQAVFCRCFMKYLSSPRRLPEEFLTAKGRAWIDVGARAAQNMGFAA